MRWFFHRETPPVAAQFDDLLDEVIDDFEKSVKRHRQKLFELREALRERQ